MLQLGIPSPSRAADTARLLRALANPRRLLILCRLLQAGQASAGDLADHLGLAPSALSQHLARMRREGLVSYRREARTLIYQVADGYAGRLTRLLQPICADDEACVRDASADRTGQAATALDLALATPQSRKPGFWETPAITAAGRIHQMPRATYRPNRRRVHKVVFAVTQASREPERASPGLVRVARAVNLYAAGGVPQRRLRLIAIIYGPATAAVLEDARYRKQFGSVNPNLPVIRALRNQGVTIAVCGQAIAGAGYTPDWVSKDAELVFSGITAIDELQQQGYVLMPS